MTNVLQSFTHGWRSAVRLWPVVLLLYVVDSALALLMALPPVSQLAAAYGNSAMAPEIAAPPSLDLLVELSTSIDLANLPWLLYLTLPLLSAVLTTFLRGGVLGALAREPERFSWERFFGDCFRHFGRLLILLLLYVPGLILAGLLFVALGLVATLGSGAIPDPWDLAIYPALLGLLLMLLLAAVDYARISLVLEPHRSVWRHGLAGFAFVVRRFPSVVLLALVFWLTIALPATLYPAMLGPWAPFSGFLPVFVVQQASALLASLHRVAMLGAQTSLFSLASPSRTHSPAALNE
jgi:hypothetical protein